MANGRAGGVGGVGVGGGFTTQPGVQSGGGFMSGLKDMFSGMDFDFGGEGFGNLLKGGSLALGAYGLNESLGLQEDQLGIMKDQENRAATAQNFSTGNSLAMALQTTTPGTPEHERIKQAMANNTYQV